MALIEGADYKGFSSLTIITNYTKPTKTGAGAALYSSNKTVEASVNKNAAKVGATVIRYAPALSLLFANENF